VTWVLGISGFPTGAIAASDIRITLDSGSHQSQLNVGVQKIHRVAPHVVIGFAGSIGAGFEAVTTAQLRWRRLRPNWIVGPEEVGERLAQHMRRAWPMYRPEWQRGSCQLLVLGFVPSEATGVHLVRGPTGEMLPLIGQGLPGALTRVFTMQAPLFELRLADDLTPVAIGSGARVQEWSEHLERFVDGVKDLDDRQTVFRLGTFAPMVFPAELMIALDGAMAAAQEPSVSPYMEVATVGPGNALMYLRLPPPIPVARTWDEYRALGRQHGFSAVRAFA